MSAPARVSHPLASRSLWGLDQLHLRTTPSRRRTTQAAVDARSANHEAHGAVQGVTRPQELNGVGCVSRWNITLPAPKLRSTENSLSHGSFSASCCCRKRRQGGSGFCNPLRQTAGFRNRLRERRPRRFQPAGPEQRAIHSTGGRADQPVLRKRQHPAHHRLLA